MVGSKLFVFLSHILLWISSIELSEMFASSVVGFLCVCLFVDFSAMLKREMAG